MFLLPVVRVLHLHAGAAGDHRGRALLRDHLLPGPHPLRIPPVDLLQHTGPGVGGLLQRDLLEQVSARPAELGNGAVGSALRRSGRVPRRPRAHVPADRPEGLCVLRADRLRLALRLRHLQAQDGREGGHGGPRKGQRLRRVRVHADRAGHQGVQLRVDPVGPQARAAGESADARAGGRRSRPEAVGHPDLRGLVELHLRGLHPEEHPVHVRERR
mmetsp:Transcript_6346/g.16961  ORF Transcript_6346/g.16961 Transcript_6346/m.16961 type:complete len:215 (+) Transcript_6346:878-1522(+)